MCPQKMFEFLNALFVLGLGVTVLVAIGTTLKTHDRGKFINPCSRHMPEPPKEDDAT